MPMKKDLSALPQVQTEGVLPDAAPFFAPLLAAKWAETIGDGHLDMAFPEARLRHSWAGFCARRIGYQMRNEPCEPPDIADRWRMGLGTIVHERWQEAIAKAFPEAEIEKKVWIEDCKSAGHIDAVIQQPDGVTSFELKTINGFGFKQSIGSRGPAEGPRSSALVQCALNAYAAEADRMAVVYLSTENLSPREADKMGPEPWRKFCAEWTLESKDFTPIAHREIARFKSILACVDRDELPPRAIPTLPHGARITNPWKGDWQVITDAGVQDAGTTWECRYCPYQQPCSDSM